ncbi:hypothetical protein PR202_gb29325 [Eleusine coracana subsp. coracana]|uniref:PGG domain-containing protein n=1 Tax=Eleusine coracana subsp. coracana TaxID=191504 RepID=A0AAV5FZK9_ELECO|nr:hypothetical protein PR202_gb29325 [Eleusine coracana subsp. coracana]
MKWRETTSKNLAIVSTLVATIAFSAVFNVPGSYGSDGKANLNGNHMYNAFVVLDTIAGKPACMIHTRFMEATWSNLSHTARLRSSTVKLGRRRSGRAPGGNGGNNGELELGQEEENKVGKGRMGHEGDGRMGKMGKGQKRGLVSGLRRPVSTRRPSAARDWASAWWQPLAPNPWRKKPVREDDR